MIEPAAIHIVNIILARFHIENDNYAERLYMIFKVALGSTTTYAMPMLPMLVCYFNRSISYIELRMISQFDATFSEHIYGIVSFSLFLHYRAE